MLKQIIFTIVVMLFSVVLISADGVDDQSNPNDPDTNDRANACYAGGDMADKCDTLWEWICGWHVIRLDAQDEDSRAAFPAGCISLLPPLIQTSVANSVVIVPISICFDTTVGGWFDQTYTSPESLGSANTWSSTDGSCSGTNTGPQTLIQAVGNADAVIRCQALGGIGTVTEMSFYSYIGGANYWFCS